LDRSNSFCRSGKLMSCLLRALSKQHKIQTNKHAEERWAMQLTNLVGKSIVFESFPMTTAFHSASKMRCGVVAGFVVILFVYTTAGTRTFAEEVHALKSPNGRIAVQIRLPPPGSSENPRWSAAFGGKSILTDCRLSLKTGNGGDLFAAVRLLDKY